VKFTGTEDMRGKIRGYAKEFPDRAGAALRKETEVIATQARKLTPVDTGNLRATVHAEGPERNGDVISCSVEAGSAAEDYAFIVHEDMDAKHRVGQAKYIEHPLNEASGDILNRVAARLKL
jgi:hypothetical protein